MMKPLADRDLGYLAGIIDGEGRISLNSQSSKHAVRGVHLAPHIDVGNTNVDLPNRLKETTGLGVVAREPRRGRENDVFRWRLRVKEMVPFLSAIRDDLVVKWEQAVILLEYLTTAWSMPLTEEHRSLRRVMFQEMDDLNRKGRRLRPESRPLRREEVRFAPGRR
jgi:hypothetical protein